MHLHLHLKDSLLDYGPVYAFWLFAFERCNGILGNYATNNKNIEVQLMRKFINQQKAKEIHFPKEYHNLQDILFKTASNHGSLHHTSTPMSVLNLKHMSTAPIAEIDNFQISKDIKILQPISKRVLNMIECKHLETVYNQLYPDKQVENISHFYLHANKIVLNDEIIGSVCSRNKKASVIAAYWPTKETLTSTIYSQLWIGTIQHFVEHKVTLKENSGTLSELNHLFCYVKWFIPHSQRDWFGTSAIVSDLFQEADCPFRYMPVQRIVCRCAHASMTLDFPTGKGASHDCHSSH